MALSVSKHSEANVKSDRRAEPGIARRLLQLGDLLYSVSRIRPIHPVANPYVSRTP